MWRVAKQLRQCGVHYLRDTVEAFTLQQEALQPWEGRNSTRCLPSVWRTLSWIEFCGGVCMRGGWLFGLVGFRIEIFYLWVDAMFFWKNYRMRLCCVMNNYWIVFNVLDWFFSIIYVEILRSILVRIYILIFFYTTRLCGLSVGKK